jgi:4-amino-4-deoxy-L-arabinose transferase-like glycosyltransferase
VSEARTSAGRALVTRNGGRAGVAALVAILLFGVGLRLDYAWEGRAPVYDAAAYARIAANLERGEGFTLGREATQPASNYSPGLPLLAGGLYALSGGVHERFARIVLALFGTLSILFAYLIGHRLWSPLAGLVGAGAVAIYPALLEYQGMLMSEPLASALLSGAVLAILWAADAGQPSRGWRGVWSPRPQLARTRTPTPRQDPRARWLVPGLLLGALVLTRPEYLAISLPIAVVVFARGGRTGWRACLAQAAIMIAGLALVVAPWTIRNAVALDRFVPVSTGGGQVLFAGSYMPSGGDPERVGEEVLDRHPGLKAQLPEDPRLEQILAGLAKQRYPALESDEALARMGRERLWDDLSERPLSYAGFVATKIGRIWSHGPRDVMREPLWEALHWALVGLGLIGLALLAWQRRWEALLMGTVLLSVTATGALLVASPRRLLVTVPLLAALAGVAAVRVNGLIQQRIRH